LQIDVKLSTNTYAHNLPTLQTDRLTNDFQQQYYALRCPRSNAHTARKTRDTLYDMIIVMVVISYNECLLIR